MRYQPESIENDNAGLEQERNYCPVCNGRGNGRFEWLSCPFCDGSGIEPTDDSEEDVDFND